MLLNTFRVLKEQELVMIGMMKETDLAEDYIQVDSPPPPDSSN